MPAAVAEAPDTIQVSNVEVFRAGTYGEETYTAQDLEQVARDYDPKLHEAPVTVDHVQTGPAYGWVTAVRAQGRKLMADMTLQPWFAGMVERREFVKRSVELYTDAQGAIGRPLSGRFYLKAVSFLGAAAPRVKGMKDIFHQDQKEVLIVAFSDDNARAEVETPRTPQLPEGMSEEEFKESGFIAKIARAVSDYLRKKQKEEAEDDEVKEKARKRKAEDDEDDEDHKKKSEVPASTPTVAASSETNSAEMAEVRAQIAKLSEANKRLDAANKRLEAEAERNRAEALREREDKRFAEAFETARREGRVAPRERESLRAAFHALPVDATVKTFGEDGEETGEQSARDLYLHALQQRPPVIDLQTYADGSDLQRDDNPNPSAALDRRVREYAEKNGMTYEEAFEAISSQA